MVCGKHRVLKEAGKELWGGVERTTVKKRVRREMTLQTGYDKQFRAFKNGEELGGVS